MRHAIFMGKKSDVNIGLKSESITTYRIGFIMKL